MFLRIFLCSKVFIAVAIAASLAFVFNASQFESAFANWSHANSIASRLGAWDSAHYLRLSQTGYLSGSLSCAFYPLWPGIIHAAALVALGNPLLAGMVVANAMSLGMLWLFYNLVRSQYGEHIAKDSTVLMLAFPGAMFFSLPYTESLFLLLVLIFFVALERERYAWVAVTCLLMPLTKAIGVFMVLPLAWRLFERRAPLKQFLLLAVPPLGYASYFGIMWFYTGNAFEGFVAQEPYPNSPSIQNMLNISAITTAFIDVRSIDGMLDSFLDRALFVVFLCTLPLIYRLNKTWFFYTLAAGLVPALTSWFISYRRYFIVLFPIFIVLAQLIHRTRNRPMFWYYIALLTSLQAWAITRYMTFNWAG